MPKITRNHVKDFLRNLVTAQSEVTAELAHVILCRVFDEAIEDGIITWNPAKNLHNRIFKERRKDKDKFKPNPFSVEERDRFLKFASSLCHPALSMLFEILSFSGMRLGEAQALRVNGRYLWPLDSV